MTKLATSAIAALAANAGFPHDQQATAVAVALAESRGDSNAANGIPCVGLWQINCRVWKQFSVADMHDPAKNAAAALFIYKEALSRKKDPWSPWSTYNSQAYKQFMPKAEKAVSGVGSNPQNTAPTTDVQHPGETVGDAAVAVADENTGIVKAIETFTETLRKSALTYMVVVFAVVLLILGIVLLARNGIMDVVPAGKAVKIASKVLK